ncbi:hypothetical protein HZQ11_13720 [Elizabethkingia anophelis]|uniref:MobA protein n=1 Tax=Elizabethkingia anophelis TaxID=1117645 RepID=A0A455ZEF2_9FLAO|nr:MULTISPECIES: conjugal transfer protein MobA [Elizabethkingia]KUF46148.1 hypothetical protein AS358_10510 [Elizabethkingia anophelis]MCT3644197.1 hypothetical protein [Elizabethkingia anophelis]MCT3650544.1 hypothetical protein [Elizabethkingia anophelis]MCT3656422.1 hypothetical protein [Elizabethkingia anophelis]MCT3657968.1 hypothetical protein [Elizabethkingia anophelis]
MEQNNERPQRKGGRISKIDPAIFRYSISFNRQEHARFLSLYEQSGMKIKAHFITSCIFGKTMKTVKVDMATMDYYMRLTTFYGQFRAIGVNYNQVVRILYRNFSDKKAAAYLFKLENQTAELAKICLEIKQLTEEFEHKYLNKQP